MRRCAVPGASSIVAVATVVSTEASAVAAPRPTPGVSGAGSRVNTASVTEVLFHLAR
jgi:hypothetical protein